MTEIRKNALFRLDPRTGIMMVMCWSFVNALGFAVQADAQQRPIFRALAKLGLPNSFYCTVIIIDLLMLTCSLLPIKNWIKAVTSACSSTIWIVFGYFVFKSGEGSYLMVGGFSMCVAVGCIFAASQWAHQD